MAHLFGGRPRYGPSRLRAAVAEGTELEDINDIETGSTEGQLVIDYDFLNIPDLIRVYYDGVVRVAGSLHHTMSAD